MASIAPTHPSEPPEAERGLSADGTAPEHVARISAGSLSALHTAVGAAAGAACLMALSRSPGAADAAVFVLIAFFVSGWLIPRETSRWQVLPLMRIVMHGVGPFVGAVAVLAGSDLLGLGLGVALHELALAVVAAWGAGLFTARRIRLSGGLDPRINVAVIGPPRLAAELERELKVAGVSRYVVVGAITPRYESAGGTADAGCLGSLDDISQVVLEHGIDLLLLGAGTPRLAVFDEIASSCLDLDVRVRELSSFSEEVFCYVPTAEINATWFQYLVHPNYRTSTGVAKRALDLVLASLMGLAFLPLLAILAVLIRRDGGPVLFSQVRIGEAGRPFLVYKLRTMRVESTSGPVWAVSDHPGVSRLGRVLRRTHLDELPQVWNVLRGEMSIVGPRPEQPGFVERLEATLPFYQRRHLIRPGITGWAQVRCGYAGSGLGSAWKLCHDLYYLKHRSMSLDLVILGETVRTLFRDRQYGLEPPRAFIVHGDRLERLVAEFALGPEQVPAGQAARPN